MANGNGPRFGLSDVLMILVVLIWGVNFSFIKMGLREMSPKAFNGWRLLLTAAVFLVLLTIRKGGEKIGPGALARLAVLGFAGNTLYQMIFIQGVNRTSAANTSLLLATTPIFVVLLSSILGIERVPRTAWWGVFISFAGIIVIVSGRPGGFALSSAGVGGDLLILAGTILWAGYTVLSKPFLKTISPLQFSSVTMIFGAAFYLPFTIKDMLALRPADISAKAWLGLGFSAGFGLVLGYIIWYTSVQRVGNARTAAYNNVTPIATALFAAWLLKDPLRPIQAVGAAVILFGVWMTRSGHRHLRRRPDVQVPSEK